VQELLNGVAQGSVYALVAAGLVLIFGVVHVPHFAHGEAVMLGAMVTAWATRSLGLPLQVAILCGVASAVVFGLVLCVGLYWPMRNHPEWNVLVSSLGVVVIVQTAAVQLWSSTPRITPGGLDGSVDVAGAVIPWGWVMLVAASLLMIAGLWLYVRRSGAGLELRAMAADETESVLVGINVKRKWVQAFFVGSLLAGIAGALFSTVFPVSATLGLDVTFSALVVIILTGLGSVVAVLWVGILLGAVESAAAVVLPGAYQTALIFLVMVVVLVARPSGLFGLDRQRD
jgi:branched-chain amino acid transport system permease protein